MRPSQFPFRHRTFVKHIRCDTLHIRKLFDSFGVCTITVCSHTDQQGAPAWYQKTILSTWGVFFSSFLCIQLKFQTKVLNHLRASRKITPMRKFNACLWACARSSRLFYVLSFSFNRPISLTSKCTHILLPSLRPPLSGAAVRGSAAAVSCYDVKTMTLPPSSPMFFVHSP